ncbi:MAG TPA: S9 family peptidase [Thermomicrobiales bacterium]|nr:S9 family peptidase [Thermomicrobiales bacterium]
MQTAATGPHLTIDQLLAIRALGGAEAPQWSPDGQAVVFVSPLGGAPELWAARPADGALTRLTVGLGGVGHLATSLPRWSPTGAHLAYVSAKTGADEVWLWSADGAAERQLTRLGARVEALCWAPDGAWLAVASNARGVFDISRVAVPGGATTRLTGDRRNEVYPAVTPDGAHLLYVRLNDAWTDHDVVRMAADGGDPRVVLVDTDFFDYHYGRTFGAPLPSPDGDTFLFRSHRGGWINVWAAPAAGGEPRPIAPAAADQGDAAWSPDGRQIAYCENHNGTVEIRVVAAGGGAPRRVVAPELGVCAGPAWSPDGRQLGYLLGTPAAPDDVWVIDLASGARRQLTHSMLGGGVAARLAPPEKVAYRSFDGETIHAYLYRPPAAPGRRYPGIVWVHGGPTSQFMDTFQPQVQYFVQQGYVLLLPNVRGSSGYGRRFEDLNNRDWGGGDLRDVIAGADYLKTLPDVDAAHLGVTGTSYGGIMSMMAAAFAPGVFQAAIPCSGYGDFLHMAGEQELRHIKLLEYELGTLPEAEEVYRRCSAIERVADVTTPCFVLHGAGRYPGSSASLDFALALEAHYKPFWYQVYPGETYYVAAPANVRRQLRDMRAFFDFYLKGLPHDLPDDGTRPLTHLSGVVAAPERGRSARPMPGGGAPPRDVAE